MEAPSFKTMEKAAFYELIAQGEGQRLEFKRHIPNPHKIAKTITSLANAEGGIILVGVSDDGTIYGISPEEERYMMNKAAKEMCHPAIALHYDLFEDEEEQAVLIVHIKQSSEKPHYALNKKGKKGIYIRSLDQSRRANEKELEHFADLKKRREDPMPSTNNEIAALLYLDDRPQITIKEYAKLINSSRNKARHILTRLVQYGFLIQQNPATFRLA